MKTVKRLFNYVASTFKVQFVVVVITIIISALAGVCGPLFLMYLIDDFIVPLSMQSNPNFTPLLKTIIFLGLFYYTGVLCTYIYNRLMVNIGQGVLKRIRDELFKHMQSLPIRYFDTNSKGELMNLYTNDTDTLRQMISQSLPQMFSALISVVTIFCVMISISFSLSMIAAIMVIIMIFLTKVLGGRSGKYFVMQQENISTVNGYIEEMISGQKVIKVFCHEDETKNKFNELNENLFVSAYKANKYANVIMPVMGNIGNIQYVITAILGGIFYFKGIDSLTLGTIAAFLQLTRSFNMPFSQISQQFNSVVMALAGAERIFKAMDEVPENYSGEVTLVNGIVFSDGTFTETSEKTRTWLWKEVLSDGKIKYTQLLGNVEFKHMNFGYTREKMVLKDINIRAASGQKIAFVGTTGAGKTTITNMINRFYEVTDGVILYDGIDIKRIKKQDLRKSLGIVLQDTHLFSGTIKENIRYGNLEADDKMVIAAAKLAHAHDFINMLPKGYDTVISGDGEELSQGQCQLLAIARAAIADPPVLILDEATSSIDTHTEAIVQQGMDNLMKGRTVFVIAHRLSTIKNSDLIIVLEHGEIIEKGSHDELMKLKGKYYQLYTGVIELD